MEAAGLAPAIGHGLYVLVPLDLAGSEQVIADPWVLVPTLFNQCYIGGWTAAHHWELTEQLFNETLVFTTRRFTEKRVIAQGAVLVLHNVKPKRFFGLKTLWRGSVEEDRRASDCRCSRERAAGDTDGTFPSFSTSGDW